MRDGHCSSFLVVFNGLLFTELYREHKSSQQWPNFCQWCSTVFSVCSSKMCCTLDKILATTVTFLCRLSKFKNRVPQNTTRVVQCTCIILKRFVLNLSIFCLCSLHTCAQIENSSLWRVFVRVYVCVYLLIDFSFYS